jgi:hypothetical protein
MISEDFDNEWNEPGGPRRHYVYDQPLPHSGMGIASCIIGACAFFLGIVLFVIAAMMEASNPNAFDEESPQAFFLGLLLLLDVSASLVGLVLGIVGVAIGNRNKLFAGLGIGLNALIFLGLIAVSVIGLTTD